MNQLDVFASEVNKIDRDSQDFVFKLRERMKAIYYEMGDDFDAPKYTKGLAQIKFLEECINIIVSQQNISVTLTDLIWKEYLWTLDKETELAQTKLELNRMKRNNALLLKLFPKLVINNSTNQGNV